MDKRKGNKENITKFCEKLFIKKWLKKFSEDYLISKISLIIDFVNYSDKIIRKMIVLSYWLSYIKYIFLVLT